MVAMERGRRNSQRMLPCKEHKPTSGTGPQEFENEVCG